MNRKGFTLIEVMIVVVIVGLLTALAYPRFKKATTTTKFKEAESILKKIFQASQSFYEEYGLYPPVHDFNNATIRETSNVWTNVHGLHAHKPTAEPRFTYRITVGGYDRLEIVADPRNSWDQSIRIYEPVRIRHDGVIIGGM